MSFFNTAYLNLIDQVKETPAAPYKQADKITERFVRCLWMEQPFKKPLTAVNGDAIQIISPGWWSMDAGPDFINATISINSQSLIKGDVEIHINSKDWDKHGHKKNPRFNKTILHAFLWNDSKKLDPSIAQFEISKFLKSDIPTLRKHTNIDSYPLATPKILGACNAKLKRLGNDDIKKILQMAGDARIIKKSVLIPPDTNSNEILYESIMKSLGYKRNAESFMKLAKKVPYSNLATLIEKENQLNKADLITSTLLKAGGLMPKKESDIFTKETIFWNLFQTRPANYPHRRIAGMGRLLTSHKMGNFESLFKSLFMRFDKTTSWKKFFESYINLFNKEDPFWSYHYTYSGKKLTSPLRLIGEGRIKTILINTLIPFFLSRAKQQRDTIMEEKLHTIFSIMPSAEANSITRFMEHRLTGDKIKGTGKGRAEQGLLQIFNDYCLKHTNGCAGCTFSDKIKKLV